MPGFRNRIHQVVHEVRQALTVIRGRVALLHRRTRRLPPETQADFTGDLESIDHQVDVITDRLAHAEQESSARQASLER